MVTRWGGHHFCSMPSRVLDARPAPVVAKAVDPAEIRALFPGLRNTLYFNTSTMCVGAAPAREAYERAVERWSAGRFDWAEAEQAGEGARAMFARIVGALPEQVALVPAVSAAAGIVAANLPAAQPGENIVVAAHEFTSNYFPWVLLRERGYELRSVVSTADGPPADAYAAMADGGTRLIAVSAVHSATGFRTDLAAMSRVAARSGAWLFVDACQAAGAVPLDVVRDRVDFLAAAGHKYLLGSRGMGYLYVRPRLLERLRPVLPGWKAARKPMESFIGPAMDLSPTASRLDTSLAWFAALADRAAFGVFERFGIDAVFERNAALSRRLHAALAERDLGYRPFPEAHRSTIVTLPADDLPATMARLEAAGVVAAAPRGRIRLSVHLYNLEEEIERVVELLADGR
jgi:selenocysteine lyase/cysteine desulfurase